MLRPFLAALFAASLLAACGGSGDAADATPEVRYCLNRDQCGADETCLQGVCGRECLWDEDCGDVNAFVCRAYECQPASVEFGDAHEAGGPDAPDILSPDGVAACAKDLDCKPFDLVCLAGRCDKECDVDVDCGDPAKTCYAHRCFAKTADGAPEVIEPDAVEPEPDASDAIDKKPYGSLCDLGSECEGEWCVQNLILDKKTCTHLCGGDGDSGACPGKDVCVGPLQDQEGVNRWVCVANDAGSSNCNACMSGISLTNPQGNCLCTAKCPDVSKCPLNMSCAPVSLGGVPTPVCVPVGQPCDPTQPNTSPCYGVCLPRDANAYFCTTPCDGAGDCALGTVCHGETVEGVLVQWCIAQ
jgi:hypothetical protein